MLSGTPGALEFDRIIALVRSYAATPLAGARLAALHPSSDPEVVARALATTSECVRLLSDSPGLPLRNVPDLEDSLAALAVEGRALDALRLLALADFLDAVQRSAQHIRREARHPVPLLRAIAERVAAFDGEIAAIRRRIEPSGELVDDASPALRSLRDRLRKQRARLRNTLESYLRGRDTAKYLQEQVVTTRNGRFVLVLKAEHRGGIPGIVHGASTSGASLFLEPLSTVEVNNDIVALEEQEAEEVRRILLELTDALRSRPLDLANTVDAAAELDVVQAKARVAQLTGGVVPRLATDGRIELRGARHPLLVPAVASRLGSAAGVPTPSRTAEPMPVDLLVAPPTTALVITGPNTGGKTVALKTAGLLALMAQSGFLVPADEGSALPVFRAIFADIGDAQSIAASLSTFSSHIANIVSMDAALDLPALALLDEVGAGTDPVEGGALGMSIVDHFRRRGALVIATTHDEVLKTYATTTEGVAVASFGFEPETFAPTYRLRYGVPGASLALEIAARLGLAPTIIEQARAQRSLRESQLSAQLARVDEQVHALEHERRLVARERAQLAEREVQLATREARIREQDEASRRRLSDEVNARLRDARREIDAAVDDLKRRTNQLAQQAARRQQHLQPVTTGETGQVRNQARAQLDDIAERLVRQPEVRRTLDGAPPARQADVRSDAVPTPGARVAVGPLGLEGIVQSISGREAEVTVNGKRLRTKIEHLAVLKPGPKPQVAVHVNVPADRSSPTELNVVGRTVDEALDLADKFLDGAVVASQRTVRVIHGHGTGQLRRALASFFEQHPLVQGFAAAPPERGGSGVTIVELKD